MCVIELINKDLKLKSNFNKKTINNIIEKKSNLTKSSSPEL